MSLLASLDWFAVKEHYSLRERTHELLLTLHESKSVSKFVGVALGIDEPSGNYSANEHAIGPKILASNQNAERRVFDLAAQFLKLKSAATVPAIVKSAGIKHLAVGVGSEISCMLNPGVCWVANIRTIWTDLTVKHNDSVAKANEHLMLYRQADLDSEMAYIQWSALHAELGVPMTRIAESGSELAARAGISPGPIKLLWADAIASELYDFYHA